MMMVMMLMMLRETHNRNSQFIVDFRHCGTFAFSAPENRGIGLSIRLYCGRPTCPYLNVIANWYFDWHCRILNINMDSAWNVFHKIKYRLPGNYHVWSVKVGSHQRIVWIFFEYIGLSDHFLIIIGNPLTLLIFTIELLFCLHYRLNSSGGLEIYFLKLP